MSNWTVSFFDVAVKEKLLKWPVGLKAKLLRNLELLERYGPFNVGMPLIKPLGDGLFEVRSKSHDGLGRVFFCMLEGREILILHSYIKKTQKIPPKELKTALKRMHEVKYRGKQKK